MRITITMASTIAFLGFLLPASLAQASGCQGDASDVATHIFDASDTDANGALSAEEYANAGLERYGVSFEAFDANADGETSLDEYLDLFEQHHPPTDGIEI